VAVIKNSAAVRLLSKHRERVHRDGCGMILSNFQKRNGQVITNSQTSCEIDFEVYQKVYFLIIDKWHKDMGSTHVGLHTVCHCTEGM